MDHANDPTWSSLLADTKPIEQWLTEGDAHLGGGDVKAAVSCFGSALLLDRGSERALRGLGRCAELAGHRDTAELCFARADAVAVRSASASGRVP